MFFLAWGGICIYQLWKPACGYLHNENTIELQEKTLELSTISLKEEQLKKKKEAIEFALRYKLHEVDKLMAMGEISKWFMTDYLAKIPHIFDPFHPIDSFKRLDPDNFYQYRELKNRYEATLNRHNALKQDLNVNTYELYITEQEKQEVETRLNELLKQANHPLEQLHERAAYCLAAGWKDALKIVFFIYLLTASNKFALYYVLAPFIERLSQTVVIPVSAEASTTPHTRHSHKIITCPLKPGESFILKSETYCGGYSDNTKVTDLLKQTQWIYSTKYWLMSILCGLTILTRFTNRGHQTQTIRITSDDADEYFCQLNISPGEHHFVIPSDLVAFSSGVQLTAFNQFKSPSAWAMGQVRYYILQGEGTVILRAHGGMTRIESDRYSINTHKKHSIIHASGKLQLHARRTETLVPYLLGHADLFDQKITGEGIYHIRNTSRKTLTLPEKFSHIFFSSLGKLLGF